MARVDRYRPSIICKRGERKKEKAVNQKKSKHRFGFHCDKGLIQFFNNVSTGFRFSN